MKLSLAAKFNIVFLSIFGVGFVAASAVTKLSAARERPRGDLAKRPRADAGSQCSAQLYLGPDRAAAGDAPQIQIPAAVGTLLRRHRTLEPSAQAYPDFSYKEATLNPTNLRDRAADWEATWSTRCARSRRWPSWSDSAIPRPGRPLYLARPLQIKSEACLRCHSVPDAGAPRPCSRSTAQQRLRLEAQ